MSSATKIIRARRRRGAQSSTSAWWFKVTLALMTASILAMGFAGLFVAYSLAESSVTVAGAGSTELSFMQAGREAHIPVRFYDRDQGEVLFEVLNPDAKDRRWYQIDPEGSIALPEFVIEASYSAQETDYWAAQSRPLVQTISAILDLLNPTETGVHPVEIADLLVDAQVLPLPDIGSDPSLYVIQRRLAAIELSARHSQIELLEFFINTADYGNLAYGIDAAALVYFGKHAASLDLAESAMLAPIPFDPEINPFDAPEEARARQRELIRTMRARGLISSAEAQQAFRAELSLRSADGSEGSSLEDFLLSTFEDQFGRRASGRNGLKIRTSIDGDLQEQSQCVLSVHVDRLNNVAGSPLSSSDCLASELLPPLRPGDAGQDHGVRSGALVVIDVASGEVLSLAGSVQMQRPISALGQPFIYLTAFAEGYSPGSMVLDLPTAADVASVELERFRGPVRIRTAMANSYTSAAEQMVELVGVESVLNIFETMGIEVDRDPGEDPEDWQAALLDIVHASSAFANDGVLVGQTISGEAGSVEPVLILEIVDVRGRLVHTTESEKKAVLSEQLAYLINDVLSDEVARRERFGPSNPLEVNRPAGATAALSADGRDAWTIGYTPERVVGIWMGNPTGPAPNGLTIRNGAAPVWHALMIYASRDIPSKDWQLPLGVTRVEVCDPSGLLPTVYCPETAREPFISGTEPTTFDNLFQPYLVNKETGKLATLSTPVGLVEERVYLVPPPEALVWASATGIEQPPQEYDTLTETGSPDPDLRIVAPEPFEFLRGVVRVRGYVAIDELDFYRLQVGKGLNPLNWLQLGEDRSVPVRGGTIAEWDTKELEGLYTLQLIAVQTDGQVRTAIVQVTIDNEPPAGRVVFPEEGQVFTGTRSQEVAVQVEAQDSFEVERVVIFVDEQEFAVIQGEPFSTRWPMRTSGSHTIHAEIYDLAGNMIKTDEITIQVVRP